MMRQFIPFNQVDKQEAIIVDSVYRRGLVLAHWRGAGTPELVRGDTSADCVFNALHQGLAGLESTLVTANHFDIDGFVGVWTLLNPELALQHEAVLRQMATIGDFRELNLDLPEAHTALKLVCWLNAREKELFYAPFGAEELAESEVIASVPKFEYFLREFEKVLLNPETAKMVWLPEYTVVLADYQKINNPQTVCLKYPEIGLVVIQTPEPVHYYALFSLTSGFDMVLSMYPDNRYELEYKYTTWIDLASRPTLPRLPLKPLITALNKIEQSGLTWSGEHITDTGPILRLDGKYLSKVQRYANPTERPIISSSVAASVLEQLVVKYCRQSYKGISAKKYWTWEEIKQLSKKPGSVFVPKI